MKMWGSAAAAGQQEDTTILKMGEIEWTELEFGMWEAVADVLITKSQLEQTRSSEYSETESCITVSPSDYDWEMIIKHQHQTSL